ncbi:MAG: S9 family peptidase [Janthinobacterium lividum]
MSRYLSCTLSLASRRGLSIALLFGTAALHAQSPAVAPVVSPASGVKHGMTLDDMTKMLRVGAPVVSPDGKWIAYTVSHVDTGEDKNLTDLWMVSWDGTQDIQLTRGKDGAGEPRWSPDGRFLAFTSGREGEAKGSQVWVLDRRGGEAQQLTDVKENLRGYRWSPDSKQLLLTIVARDEPEPEKGAKPKPPKPIVIERFHFKQDVQGFLSQRQPHLFLFDIASRKLTKLTSSPVSGATGYAEADGEWSPDGKLVAFTSNQSTPDPDRFDNGDVFVVAATAGATPRKLTTFAGPDEGPLAWTPDSARILYRQALQPHYSIYNMPQLAAIPAAGGTPEMLASRLDQWVSGATVTPDGKHIFATVQDDRNDYVAEISLDGKGSPRRLTEGQGEATALHQAGGHTALLWTADNASPEIYALEGMHLRKLTAHNDALLATLNLAPTTDLSAKASDGSEVHSLLTMPVGYIPGAKVPMVLFIHGGPTAQDAHGFRADRQLFAAHGYAMLNVNYRGGTGRGHAYSEAISADWGDKEVLDLQAAVDGALATGNIDPDKLVVGGWSYGGILTDYMIASTHRFKAASSGAGMGNLLGFYGVDQYILQYENELGPPWKNLDAYIKLSYPFLHADRINTPTLFMGGDKDFNVPIVGGEQMYEALKSVGIEAELIVYPGEFHGFTRPSFIRDRYVRWFDWYDHYALGTPSTAIATSTGGK